MRQVILNVYVDDFELAGKQSSLAPTWQPMRDKCLKLDPPELFKEYLGCGQRTITVTPAEVQQRLEHIHPVRVDLDKLVRVDPNKLEAPADIEKQFAGIPIRAISYGMRGFSNKLLRNTLSIHVNG